MPANIDNTYVIQRPLLTEKGTYGMNEQGRYTFLVDRRATKEEIKTAVEAIYKVKVVGVNTQVRKGKTRRFRQGEFAVGESKKATIRLRDGDKIELF